MTTIIEAIYERGLFRPIGKVDLKEGTHVELRVQQSLRNRDPRAVAAKLAQLAGLGSSGREPEMTARDHDQVLYGRKSQP